MFRHFIENHYNKPPQAIEYLGRCIVANREACYQPTIILYTSMGATTIQAPYSMISIFGNVKSFLRIYPCQTRTNTLILLRYNKQAWNSPAAAPVAAHP